MTLLFTVVIPVYNVANYLHVCLDSIANAVNILGEPVEVICVDDGSTDNSGIILDAWSEENKASCCICRVIHQTNSGVSSARNAALEIASGKWICFIDGDDAVSRDYFAVLKQIIENSNSDIVRFDNCPFKGDASEYEDSQTGRCEYAVSLVDFRGFVGSTIAWNACYRRETIGDLRFAPIPNGEDILFAAEAFMRASKTVATDARIYRYRHRDGSAVNTASMRHFVSKCEMCRLLKERIHHPELKRKLRNHLAGEILPMIAKLPKQERENGWRLFFDTLNLCAWNNVAELIAWSRSGVLARLVFGSEISLRHILARIRAKLNINKLTGCS